MHAADSNLSVQCVSVGLLVADHLCTPIARLPEAGQLVLSDRLPLTVGGCACNAAMDLARVGVNVAAVGCVGSDIFGQFIIDTLANSCVDCEGIRRLADVETSQTLIINVKGQDRRFIHSVGANARLSPDDIPMDLVLKSRVFYVGGYLILPSLDPSRLAEQFRAARAAGVRTVLDVVHPGTGDHREGLEILLPETDVFLPNTDEAALITGESDAKKQAMHFRDMGAETVVITCGGEGTVAVTRDEQLWAASHKVEYVGGTGAGDAFDAGFIAALIDGGDLTHCLAWGSALGASCVRSISATESVFTRPEAEEFMRANPLTIRTW
jgi:sugar/nucleoside kinase (ribokinase family)